MGIRIEMAPLVWICIGNTNPDPGVRTVKMVSKRGEYLLFQVTKSMDQIC